MRILPAIRLLPVLLVASLLPALPALAQGGPGTTDFAIRDFGACINLPDFTVVTEPDAYNTVYEVPGLFAIHFAEYLLPLERLPTTNDAIYQAMIALLDTVGAGDYLRVPFQHDTYLSAAVEFTLNGRRMFGMIYRSQNDKLFFLFADKVEGFDMLAIGRAIFPADGDCEAVEGATPPPPPPVTEVYGTINEDTTWHGEVHVIGDVSVSPGVTLTILPGAVVRVAAHRDVQNLMPEWGSNMRSGINPGPNEIDGVMPGEPFYDEANHVSIAIGGILHAVGTPDNMIHIVSDSPTPGRFDWNHFQFHEGILSYAHVENFRQLGCDNVGTDNFTISHSILSNAGAYAVGVCNGTAVIEHNVLFNTSHELIYVCNGSSAIIQNNHLGPNPGNIGVAICGDSSPQVYNNVIEGTEWGIRFLAPPAAPVFEGNVFVNNGTDWHHGY